MKILGIIAEYNPFHNGHEYMIKALKESTSADYVVVVMSGDFVQSGAPAIVDKYVRTRMALSCGADLVLELPIYYSTGSAEFFAKGAVSILNGLNCVDFLGFGSETDDTESLTQLADFLANESDDYKALLKENLKKGQSFPTARSNALTSLDMPFASLISSPNDILGVEYIKALLKLNSSITPVSIKRKGAGYHEHILQGASNASDLNESPVCSAEEIRRIIEENSASFSSEVITDANMLSSLIPAPALSEFADYVKKSEQGLPCFNHVDNLSGLLHYKLLSEKNYGFGRYLDVSSDLSDKIIRSLNEFTTISEFIMKLKSKDLTYTHLNRGLLHILLNITDESMSNYAPKDAADLVSYARILGLNKNASPLLKRMQNSSSIPVISRLSDANRQLSDIQMSLLSETISASEVYDLTMNRANISEYSKQICIISR